MATEVYIPNLGHTMTIAEILKFLKSVGDPVEAGETLLEIETDKVNYGIEAPVSGVVKAILVNDGDKVPVGGIVAVIGEVDEEIDVHLYQKQDKGQTIPEALRDGKLKEAVLNDDRMGSDRIAASPVARKMAKEKGVDLSLVKGSGRSGQIRMADVERYLREAKPEKVEAVPPPGTPEIEEVIPMTSMRRTIARRLSQSFHDVPHINLCTEVDMAEVKRLCDLAGEETEAQAGVKLSFNDIFIKVVAITLRDFPLLNARFHEDKIEVLKNINIGLAVALDEGLIVPAIENADQKRLWQIAKERKDLVERARQGHLSLLELERGTFTISNLGMFDIVFFTSILNPPQTGILSIGKTVNRPVVMDESIVIRPIVQMSLAVDHRVVDGAVGAQFLQALKKGFEGSVSWS